MGTDQARSVLPTINFEPSTLPSKPPLLEFLLGRGSVGVMTRLGFVVALADLAFDLLGDDVYGRVQILLPILGKQVRAADCEADGAGELLFRDAFVVVFESDARVNDALIQMFNAFEFVHHMFFDCLGQRDIVSVKNQFHTRHDAIARP